MTAPTQEDDFAWIARLSDDDLIRRTNYEYFHTIYPGPGGMTAKLREYRELSEARAELRHGDRKARQDGRDRLEFWLQEATLRRRPPS